MEKGILVYWFSLTQISFILFLPNAIKTTYKWLKFGYKIGDQHKKTYVTVHYEYANTYSVSSKTKGHGRDGVYFALIIALFAWYVFFMIAGPIVLICKMVFTAMVIINYITSNKNPQN